MMDSPMPDFPDQSRALPTTQARRIDILGIGLEIGAETQGTEMGAKAMRLAGLHRVLEATGHAVHDHGMIADAGVPAEVAMDPAQAARCRHLGEVAAWVRAVHDRAYLLARDGGVPMFIGGDHSISMGTISGIARARKEVGRRLAVLWLDAHADYNTPQTTPSGNLHGMALALLTGDAGLAPVLDRPFPPVDRTLTHVFGARSIDPPERLRLAADGIDVVDMRQIDERGVSALMAERIERWQHADVDLHVSLDVDFLDPAVAPGTGTVVPGGATYREAHLVMEMLHDSGLVRSLDVVELNPFLDERGRSAFVMTELVASLFGRTVFDRPRRPMGA